MLGQPIRLTKMQPGGEWPNARLLDQLALSDWQPKPFSEFVIKVHSRCNLACDYCYIYEMGDNSWQEQPPSLSVSVAVRAAERIAEHALEHQLERVSLVLHGGEPLLIGEKRLQDLLETFDAIIGPVCTPEYGIQTNGLLLTDSILGLLSAFDCKIGVSLDGGRAVNDKHRQRRNGAGTFDAVAQRLHELRNGRHSSIYAGILATIDVSSDPVQVYRDLRFFGPPKLDFLLPHGNWNEPPPGLIPESTTTPYADWLIKIFDHWFASSESEPGIRLFDEVIRQFFGKPMRSESIGLEPIALATIQTDGSFELVDTLKSAFDGAASTGMNIHDHSLDQLLRHPSVAARQIGLDALGEVCTRCEVVDVCGGGYYPHRYQRGAGFRNPSVYCRDLLKLIQHIHKALEFDSIR